MKSLVALWVSLHRDACNLYHIDPSRDVETVTRRHRLEGEPFLTITLDAYRVAFEAALEAGTWDSIPLREFRKDGHLPAFLRGFVSLVFQRDGRVRDRPDRTAIAVIRQLLGFAAKQHVRCHPKYERKALTSFIEVDEAAVSPASADLKSVFAALFDRALRDVSDDIAFHRLVPRHGNGASQDKILPNERWDLAQWDTRLERVFPSWRYARVNDHHLVDVGCVQDAAETTPVRVQFVPKTAKGPRTIAIEPSWRMFAQQALRRSMTEAIERYHLPPRFTSNTRNRELAREGSVGREWATIDLSSASDSVSLSLVSDLFGGRRLVRDMLLGSRSGLASLPDGTTRALNKFASMGSAVCFPVEAMVFSAIAVLAMMPRDSRGNLDLSKVPSVAQSVTVYGDDIIVPSEWYHEVTSQLGAFGFKVNEKKSFVKGFFRESCGADFYLGTDVSYVKVRRPLAASMSSPLETVSTVSLRNQLARRGLWPETVRQLDRYIQSGLGLFPYGEEAMCALVRTSSPEGADVYPTVTRMNKDLQRPEVRAFTVVSQSPESTMSGWAGVHKSLLSLESSGDEHEPPSLETWNRAGQCESVRLKTRWLPVGR